MVYNCTGRTDMQKLLPPPLQWTPIGIDLSDIPWQYAGGAINSGVSAYDTDETLSLVPDWLLSAEERSES